MKLSQLNDYIQTLATIGAIAGLMLVAYEIRQSSRIAVAESYRDGSLTYLDLLLSGLESGVSSVLIKAETDRQALTPEEKAKITLWLNANVQSFANEYSQIEALGVNIEEELRDYDEVVKRVAPGIFSSAWSRAWFYERQTTIRPRVAEAIRLALERSPLDRKIHEFKRIDERAAMLE